MGGCKNQRGSGLEGTVERGMMVICYQCGGSGVFEVMPKGELSLCDICEGVGEVRK